jgi:hypothetical protein
MEPVGLIVADMKQLADDGLKLRGRENNRDPSTVPGTAEEMNGAVGLLERHANFLPAATPCHRRRLASE